MVKHSFKKGDRVVCRETDRRGVFSHFCGKEAYFHADDGVFDCKETGTFWVHRNNLEHDRDFCVADWVRYECVKPMPLSHLLRDGMQGKVVECLKETVSVQFSEHGGLFVLKDNLVKIAPPTEEKVAKADTITIEHDQWGRVEGVEKAWSPRDLSHWAKEENGRKTIFNESKGWREVNPTRWVPVCVAFDGSMRNLKIGSRNNPYEVYFILPEGYRWKKAEIEREEEVEG